MRRLAMCRKQFVLNVCSETTRPRALIFGMKHCLVNLYQVCSIGDLMVQNGPAEVGLGFNQICLKSSLELLGNFRCLKFGV